MKRVLPKDVDGVAVEVQDLEVAQTLEAGTYFLLRINVYFGANQAIGIVSNS